MKAIRLKEPENISFQEIEVPSPSPGEILLKVRAAQICGTDLRMYRHGHKGRQGRFLTLGHEVAGEIAEIGKGVRGYSKGKPAALAPNYGCGVCNLCVSGQTHLCRKSEALGVTRDGGFAEYMLVPALAVSQGNVTEMAEGTPFDEASLVEPFSCVLNAFERCHKSVGETVLVIGAGPIGLMHAILHTAAGAAKVIVNDLNRERLEAARQIDPDWITVDSDLESCIDEESGGEGADVVITAAPVPAIQKTALEVAAINGRVVFFGGLPTDSQEVMLNTNIIHYKQLIVTGTTRQSVWQFRKAVKMIETGKVNLKPLLSKSFSLEEFDDALEYALAGKGFRSGFSIGG